MFDPTLLTSHKAAPVELAPASFNHDSSACLEASPTTHQLAAVSARRVPVADATARAERPRLAVRLAEVGRRGHEDEVCVGGRPEAVVAGDQFAT